MIPRWLTDNLSEVARRLAPLEIEFAFLGGCIVPLLLDEPGLVPMRPTNDVDVVILLVRQSKMAMIEAKPPARIRQGVGNSPETVEPQELDLCAKATE